MTDTCELCDSQIMGKDCVVLNGHVVCYECIGDLVEIKIVQEDEDNGD